MPSEEQENSNHAEPPAASSQLEGAPDVHLDIRSASSQSGGASDIEDESVSVREESKYVSMREEYIWEARQSVMPQSLRRTASEPIGKSVSSWKTRPEETGSGRNSYASPQSAPPLNTEDFLRRYSNVDDHERIVSLTEYAMSTRKSEGKWEVLEDAYRPLLKAIFQGDWESAKGFFKKHASERAIITGRGETALHIAALSAHDQFFEELVKLLLAGPSDVLQMVDNDGHTALHIAVLSGRIRMVKALIDSNAFTTQLLDDKKHILLATCSQVSAHKEIAWLLAKSTADNGSRFFETPFAITPIIEFTIAGHYDIVHYLVGKYPHLLRMKESFPMKAEDLSILGVLARADSHFLCKNTFSVLEALIFKCIPVDWNYEPTDEFSRKMQASTNPALRCFTRPLWNAAKILVPKIKRIHEKKLIYVGAVELTKRVCNEIASLEANKIEEYFQEESLFRQAIIKGNSEFLKICAQFFPDIFIILPEGEKLMTRAVAYRQERILSLFLKVTSTNELSLVPAPTPEGKREMMLVAVRHYSHFNVGTYISGAAFQMQRELQWFNAVESWLYPGKRVFTQGKTFWQQFVEHHQKLRGEGEKWVKDTADKCMLVSTLIATVLFAAAFTVPGGNDDKTGVPLLLGQDSVLTFTISNALGLFSSITAIMLFLAILTSRYEPQDFLHSLPEKIIMGLSFLFLSLAFMLVAFVATLKISLDKRLEWAFIPITLLASLPVALFLRLQLPLLLQMVKSTYGPSIFHPEDIWK